MFPTAISNEHLIKKVLKRVITDNFAIFITIFKVWFKSYMKITLYRHDLTVLYYKELINLLAVQIAKGVNALCRMGSPWSKN